MNVSFLKLLVSSVTVLFSYGSVAQTLPVRWQRPRAQDVTGIALSADGKTAAVTLHRQVDIWNVSDWSLRCSIPVEYGTILDHVGLSPDGTRAYGKDSNSRLVEWDTGSGKVVGSFTGATSVGRRYQVSDDGRRVFGSGSNTFYVADVASKKVLWERPSFGASVMSQDGRFVFHNDVRCYKFRNAETGRLFATYSLPYYGGALLFSPSGRYLAAWSSTSLEVIDFKDMRRYRASDLTVTCVAFAEDEHTILVQGDARGSVVAWNFQKGRIDWVSERHHGLSFETVLLPHGGGILSADGTIYGSASLRSSVNGRWLMDLYAQDSQLVTASDPSTAIVASGFRNAFEFFDVKTGVGIGESSVPPAYFRAVSPNGRYVASTDDALSPNTFVWDTQQRRTVSTFKAGAWERAALTDEGSFYVCSSINLHQKIRRFDVRTGRLTADRTFPVSNTYLTAVPYSVCVSNGTTLTFLNAMRLDTAWQIPFFNAGDWNLFFAHDNSAVFCDALPGAVTVHDPWSGVERKRYYGGSGLTHGSSKLLAQALDGSVWAAVSKRRFLRLSPDGSTATGSYETTSDSKIVRGGCFVDSGRGLLVMDGGLVCYDVTE